MDFSTIVKMAAGSAAVAFVGYCVYFDRKRHADPNFKTKLREKRKKRREAEEQKRAIKFPRPDDKVALQAFFLEQVQLGELLLNQGEIEEGAEHMAYALVVCNQPDELYNVLKQSLPQPAVEILQEKITKARKMMAQSYLQYQLGRSGIQLTPDSVSDTSPELIFRPPGASEGPGGGAPFPLSGMPTSAVTDGSSSGPSKIEVLHDADVE